MELELGLALPCYGKYGTYEPKELMSDDNFSEMNYIEQKSNFSTVNFDCDEVERKTLPLLLWNGQPNEEEEDGHLKRTFETCDQEYKEENQLVGWPPIKSWRKKKIYGIIDDQDDNRRNSRYVKVKMDGVAIGRKIDLRLYNSYQLLTNTLLQMFAKSDQSCDENGSRFTLLYQDKEGDWMLVGDVPWLTFMETVQRIQILRNGERGTSSRKSSHISEEYY